MKKIFSLLLTFSFAFTAFAETEFTFASNKDVTQTKNGITVTLAKGSNTEAPVYSSYNGMKLYANNTITINAEQVFQNVQIVFAKNENKTYAALSASPSGITSDETSTALDDKKVVKWTGNTSHLVFTLGSSGQRVIFRMVIDGEPIVIVPEEDILPTEADLVTDFIYPEPTIVGVPDTTIRKKEYAFIRNNILVHCEQGSILKAEADSNPDDDEDDSHPAYFNCNADYHITFTATQNIKGIAIDGFVRKAFNATCDHGSITYLTDPDKDEEGAPALVIQDINAKSVTLTCPKQIRCYQLRVYFVENPDPIDMGQGIESVQHSAIRVQKVLRDGQIVIIRDTKQYNVLGTQL